MLHSDNTKREVGIYCFEVDNYALCDVKLTIIMDLTTN